MARIGRFAYAAPGLALLARPKTAQADYGGHRTSSSTGTIKPTPAPTLVHGPVTKYTAQKPVVTTQNQVKGPTQRSGGFR